MPRKSKEICGCYPVQKEFPQLISREKVDRKTIPGNGIKMLDNTHRNPYIVPAKFGEKLVDSITVAEKIVYDITPGNKLLAADYLQASQIFERGQYFCDPVTSNTYLHAIYTAEQRGLLQCFGLGGGTRTALLSISAEGETAEVIQHGAFLLKFGPEYTRTCIFSPYFDSACQFVTNVSCYASTDADLGSIEEIIDDIVKEGPLYKNKIFTNGGDFIKLPANSSMDNLIIDPNIKQELLTNIPEFLKLLPALSANGLPSKRGIILEGPPGTGKSFTCRLFAGLLGITTIVISSLKCSSEITSIFKIARQLAPVLIIFEDIDIYLFDRESGDSKLSTLLNELDGMTTNTGIVTILTTNKLNVLDVAIKNRPGRFDRVIKLDYPTKDVALSMLRNFTEQYDTINVNFEEFIAYIGNRKLSGAHYKEIVITACMDYLKLHPNTTKIALTTEDMRVAANVVLKQTSVKDKSVGF